MSCNPVTTEDAPEAFEDILGDSENEDQYLNDEEEEDDVAMKVEEPYPEEDEEWLKMEEEWMKTEEEWLEADEEVPGIIYDEDEERNILSRYGHFAQDVEEGGDPEDGGDGGSPAHSPVPSSGHRRSRSRTRSRSPLPKASASPGTPSSPAAPPLSPSRPSASPGTPSSPAAPPLSPSRPSSTVNVQVQVEVVNEEVADEGELEFLGPPAIRGRGRRAGRGRAASRGRRLGRGRGAGQGGWARGDRLTEVCANDDEVQGELREAVLRDEARRAAQEMRDNRHRVAETENGADDVGVAALFDGDESALYFDWKPMASYKGERQDFLPQRTGSTTPSESVYDAFRQIWDESILSHIVTETNRYAAVLVTESQIFARQWYETNVHELLLLFAFWMMLGIIRMPSTKSCFTTNPLLKTHIFRKMFTRLRYQNLCRVLHFVDNTERLDGSSRLFPIEKIADMLNVRFKAAYTPRQEICIDESLLLWKGKLSFRQYIKTKSARFGIKTFELCESASGYLWSFIVYTGKETTHDPRFPSSLSVSSQTVLKLIWPLLDKGYTLFMDNWFNSPILARFLKKRGTDCVGTLRVTRRNVPPLVVHCELQPGQFLARHSGDVVVMAYQDRKKITLISTYHDNEQDMTVAKPNFPPQWKPKLVLDYNKGMGGVDRKDQMLEPYLLERKRCPRWNMKLFKRLLNCSILNSRILYQDSIQRQKEHLVFRLELVEQILNNHLSLVPCPPRAAPRVSRSNLPQSRLSRERPHYPRPIATQLTTRNRTSRRRCVWCSAKNPPKEARSTFECEECQVGLCINVCFKEYHEIP